MGGSGHWLGLEQVASLRHEEDLAAAERRHLLRAAGAGTGGDRAASFVRARNVAAAAVMRLLTSRRSAEAPAGVETIPQPAAGVLLD